MFFTAMVFCGCNVLKCVSVNNQECRIRPEVHVFVIINKDGIKINADVNAKN